MKAVRWYGTRDVRLEDVPEPSIQSPTDALLRVTTGAICGTDMHPYHGLLPNFVPGTILGHEFIGVVEQVGNGVQRFKPGDRALATDLVADGTCWYCRRGWHWQCVNRTLFGYGPLFGADVPGGQAQYVRVPFADTVLHHIPDDLQDEQVLFVGDILTTGYVCALNGGIQPGDTVAVVGCGPVGILAQMCARLFGPAQVLGLDMVPNRLQLAERVGSIPIDVREDAAAQVKALTDGRGADVVLECVGTEEPLKQALQVVRPKGTISVVGVHIEEAFPWPGGLAFVNELTLRYGVGDAITYGERIIELIRRKRLDPTVIISHRLPLEAAVHGYELFDKREATKVVLKM
jgi:threonine dehydrogenase-like Zn-dependent dehydrogenase